MLTDVLDKPSAIKNPGNLCEKETKFECSYLLKKDIKKQYCLADISSQELLDKGTLYCNFETRHIDSSSTSLLRPEEMSLGSFYTPSKFTFKSQSNIVLYSLYKPF